MRTYIYIDGFNLYYGSLRHTPHKWLDISKLCRKLFPNNKILKIKYFTAKVSEAPWDRLKPIKQQVYLRALHTLSNVEIIYGTFYQNRVKRPLANEYDKGKLKLVKVIRHEEKGSDVNIATHLLHDAHKNHYDTAILISNDSDLAEPIKIVSKELSKIVGLVHPHKRPSNELSKHVHFIRSIRKSLLKQCYFPPTMRDKGGPFHKPGTW